MERPLRVVVADDQSLVRAGFRLILEARGDIAVAGEACNGEDAIAITRRSNPDVLLMDIRMPVLDGLEATRRLTADPQLTTRVVILTTFDLDEYVYAALRAGAGGFLLKDTTPERLVLLVRQVMLGDALLAPSITRRLVERFARPQAERETIHHDLSTLTPRELDVLRRLGKGCSNVEIAELLFLTEATVKTHVARIFGKLGIRARAQAVVVAYETGLVQVGE